MPDSTLPHITMQRRPLSPAALKLLFVVIYILFFSITLYVIFIFSLDHVHGQATEKNNFSKTIQLQAYCLQNQINQRIVLLEQHIYLPNTGIRADAELNREITNSLESLQALVTVWQQPQALQIATALCLSVHHYNKILAEATALSKQNTSHEINKTLLNKITQELQPQAGEINSQMNDLVALLQSEIHH